MKNFSLSLFLMLMAFWIILTSTFNLISLTVGAMVCAVVVWFTQHMQEPSNLSLKSWIRYAIAYLDFLASFLLEVVKANIDVAKIVLDKKLPIQPQFIQLDVTLKQPKHLVLLANAITLTPGTLSVDVFEQHFVIHALTDQAAQAMLDPNNTLIRKIQRLEEIQ